MQPRDDQPKKLAATTRLNFPLIAGARKLILVVSE
jgi:hypothetical protein